MPNYKTASNVESEHYYARVVEIEDSKAYYKICSNDKVCEYLSFYPYKNEKDIQKTIQNMIRAYLLGESINYSIIRKSDNQIVGTYSLTFDKANGCELGYIIDYDYWNQKIMTEMMPLIIQDAFKNFKIDNIKAKVIDKNEYSIRLLNRNDFKLLNHYTQTIKGKKRDLYLYCLTYYKFIDKFN